MKKFLAILMSICMMASLLCVPVFAADPADELPKPAKGTLLRITAIKGDDTVLVGDHTNFEDGWNAAMDIAGDVSEMKKNNYDRIVVDFYASWTATDGDFTDDFWNGPGFDWDTIYIPENARVTINLNNYSINRALTDHEENGEVICVDSDADVIINSGTITGGHSDNGAGGIHIHDDAYVMLNDVHIVGNSANEDDGGGIAVYDGAVLVMNRGSFRDNSVDGLLHQTTQLLKYYGGAVYVEDSTAIFNHVEFKNNNTTQWENYGAAIYASDSDVTINGCSFDENGILNESIDACASMSIIQGDDSVINVIDSTFTNNGGTSKDALYFSSIIALDESELILENSSFSNNAAWYIINDLDDSLIQVTDTKFINNKSSVMCGDTSTSDNSFFKRCKFENNGAYEYPSFFNVTTIMTFDECSMGDSTFSTMRNIKYVGEVFKEDAVLAVSAIKKDGASVLVGYYNILEYGWNAAMTLASDQSKMNENGYEYIVVDLYVDWTASDGAFTTDDISGKGFNGDAICFPENAHVMLNMNGHTINRGLVEVEDGGEVICIYPNAKVIINDGTITGGFSDSGAGGIHVYDNVNLTLNNVDLVENKVRGDDGAAIALYDGSILVMNGGSISNCLLKYTLGLSSFTVNPYGAIYVDNSTAILNNVTIDGNYTPTTYTRGVAIYAINSNVMMDKCVVSNNGLDGAEANSIIAAVNSDFTITNTDFTGNGAYSEHIKAPLFHFDNSSLHLEGGKITGNTARTLFFFENSDAEIKNVTITDNDSVVMCIDNYSKKVNMINCTLDNNSPVDDESEIQVKIKNTLTMTDCTLGDTTFENKGMVEGVGSIFGEGSLTMIVAITALIASAAAIVVSVSSKKKAVPATSNEVAEFEDEDEE